MKKYLVTIFTIVFVFSACTTTKRLTSGIQPSEVKDMQKFETLSFISLIESGNKGKLNDTLSEKSKSKFENTLREFNDIPLTNEINLSDTITKKQVGKEIELLCLSADRQKDIRNITIAPVLDSLLEASGKRFGLLTVTSGFTRNKGNYYGGQIAKGIATGILTMGMYYQTPIKSNSTVYVMIVDAKDNNIAFFKKSSLRDVEPLDEKILKKQIEDIFEGYFWKSK
ncbi:MAG: hypothetical protein ACK5KP_10155 [Paludibacteraceae bacterium]